MRILNKARISNKIPRLMSLRARVKKYFIPKYFKQISEIDIAPIFIVGTNRSGGSLLSSLIGQHPEIENITKDDGLIRKIDGHSGEFAAPKTPDLILDTKIESEKGSFGKLLDFFHGIDHPLVKNHLMKSHNK